MIYLDRRKKKDRRTRLDGSPLPVREDVRCRERRKKLEHLAYLVLALVIGIVTSLLSLR